MKRPVAKKRTLAEMSATFDKEMEDYRKNRELWLAQHMEERKMISDFPAFRQKVDDLCVRFGEHLDDDKRQREIDRAERIERQVTTDNRMSKIEQTVVGISGTLIRMEDNTRQILEIKRSTEIMLKVGKIIGSIALAVLSFLKLILPFIKHKTNGG